ncbi:MAG: MerR family transcriptional regulator [Gaiellaceae bacterium]
MASSGRLRIGELSRRTGLSREVLRAWERRYGVLSPERTDGGLRLYSEEDLARLGVMRSHMEQGISAAEAARLALAAGAADAIPPDEGMATFVDGLRQALDDYDEAGAHIWLDRMLAAFGLETSLRDGVLPYLRELGERWARAEVTVAQEHFASRLLHGRLQALVQGFAGGSGRPAVLACPSGEQHDLGLLCFGLGLRRRGWRVAYLGADTPIATIADAVREEEARLVVLSAVAAQRFVDVEDELGALAGQAPVAIAGAGASRALAERLGSRLLDGGPLEAAAVA